MKVFIFILSILFTHSVMAGLCDNEKREYLDTKKEYRKVLKLLEIEHKKALKLVYNDTELMKKEYLTILDSKCDKLSGIFIKKSESWKKYMKSNNYKKNTELKKQVDKAEKEYLDYCGKRLYDFLYKLNPAYKQAVLKKNKTYEKSKELHEDLLNCIEIDKLGKKSCKSSKIEKFLKDSNKSKPALFLQKKAV